VGEVHYRSQAPSETYRTFRDLGDNAFEANATGVLVNLTAAISKFQCRLAISFSYAFKNGMREKTGPVPTIAKVISARGLAKVYAVTRITRAR